MAEQKLDLVEYAAGEVTKTGTRTPQVMRGQLVDPGATRGGAATSQSTFGDMPSPQTRRPC
jgi:hypothetical protein